MNLLILTQFNGVNNSDFFFKKFIHINLEMKVELWFDILPVCHIFAFLFWK